MTLEAEKKQNSSIFKLTTIHGCTLLTTKGDRKGGEIASKRELERKTRERKTNLPKTRKLIERGGREQALEQEQRRRESRCWSRAGAGAGAEEEREQEQVLEQEQALEQRRRESRCR